MPREFPTADEIRQLPTLIEHVIPEDWLDQNGHVNVQYYLTLYELAGWPLLRLLGIGPDFFTGRRLGIFDLEHHICFRSELHVGERVTLHGRFLERNAKRMHGMMFVVNDDRDALACTLEFLATGANLATRRSDAFPPDVAAGLDAAIAEDRKIQWPAPLCGAMSV